MPLGDIEAKFKAFGFEKEVANVAMQPSPETLITAIGEVPQLVAKA